MAHEEALAIVNTLQGQLAGLARSVVQALSDEKISSWESMQVGMQGMSIASSIMEVIHGTSPETCADILFVLEHGRWVMPPTA
jgi:hypothetical protein